MGKAVYIAPDLNCLIVHTRHYEQTERVYVTSKGKPGKTFVRVEKLFLPSCQNEKLYMWKEKTTDYEFFSQEPCECPRCKRESGFRAKYCWFCGAKFINFDEWMCRENIDE